MPELGSLTLPALYALTAALVVAIAITQDGAIPHYLTAWPRATIVVLAIPLIAWALQSYPVLVLIHILGAFVFVGAHAVSVFVAFQVPKETEGTRAEALLLLSASSLGWLHAGLALLIVAGVAAGFVGQWWDRPWIWLSLDLLLAVAAYMYATAPAAYHPARHSLIDEGAPGWDAAARKLVDRRRAMWLMVTGMAALLAIVVLMVLKPG
ncbi:MAG: DUF2269 family protein [Chloroflexota bacterium]|nr:DUF2269 family protein [Chloroflexota bacterium]